MLTEEERKNIVDMILRQTAMDGNVMLASDIHDTITTTEKACLRKHEQEIKFFKDKWDTAKVWLIGLLNGKCPLPKDLRKTIKKVVEENRELENDIIDFRKLAKMYLDKAEVWEVNHDSVKDKLEQANQQIKNLEHLRKEILDKDATELTIQGTKFIRFERHEKKIKEIIESSLVISKKISQDLEKEHNAVVESLADLVNSSQRDVESLMKERNDKIAEISSLKLIQDMKKDDVEEIKEQATRNQAEEIFKELETQFEILCYADEIQYSKYKMISPWTREGCAVMTQCEKILEWAKNKYLPLRDFAPDGTPSARKGDGKG